MKFISLAKFAVAAIATVSVASTTFAQTQQVGTLPVSDDFAMGAILTAGSLNSLVIDTVSGKAALESRVLINPNNTQLNPNAYLLMLSLVDATGIARSRVLNIAMLEYGEVSATEKGVRIQAAQFKETETSMQVVAVILDVELLDATGAILEEFKITATQGPVLINEPKE